MLGTVQPAYEKDEGGLSATLILFVQLVYEKNEGGLSATLILFVQLVMELVQPEPCEQGELHKP